MPHPWVPLIRIEEPAKAVRNGLAGMKIVVVGLEGPAGLGADIKFHRN